MFTLYVLKLLVTFREKLLPPRRPTHFATSLLHSVYEYLSRRNKNFDSFST